MITMTYKQLNSGHMVTAVGKMCSHPYQVKLAYKLMKLRRKLEQEINTGREMYSKLRMKYAEKSEDGTVITLPNVGLPKVNDAQAADFAGELQVLMDYEVNLEFEPIAVEELGEIALTTDELEAIQPILASEQPLPAA